MSDVEGPSRTGIVAREAVSECGQRASFKRSEPGSRDIDGQTREGKNYGELFARTARLIGGDIVSLTNAF